MSSNASTARITVTTLKGEFDAFTAAQAAHNQQVLDLLQALKPTTATTAVKGTAKATTTKAAKASKKAAATTGPTFVENRAALKALKAEGTAPAGMTVNQAVEAGLLTATAKAAPKVEVAAPAKAGKATKAKKVTGTPFPVLKAALKAHKASGAIPAQHNDTYVSVRSAITDGLMNADGSLPGASKAPKAPKAPKAKGAQVTATVADSQKAAAAEAPRRADGTITPKREWVLREQLADTGKYDRFQIDSKVAKAVRKGLI